MASGMLRAGAIESMGEKKDQTGLSQPLGLRAHQILIDNKLCWVVEIAELGFPEDEVLRVLHGVTVLVGHGTELTEVSVLDLETALLVLLHELGLEKGSISFSGVLVSEDGVAL